MIKCTLYPDNTALIEYSSNGKPFVKTYPDHASAINAALIVSESADQGIAYWRTTE